MPRPTFPTIDPDRRRALLRHPGGGRVRIVIDTDCANEIDDQFALAWALLLQERLAIEAVYAAPYSFGIYRDDLIRTAELRRRGQPLPDELRPLAGWVAGLEEIGVDPADVSFVGPAEGMEASYTEILKVGTLMGMDLQPKTFRGAPEYLASYDAPVISPAVEDLVERAMAPADTPLHVVAIGATTNIASALLVEPRIVDRIVVSWTSAYPTWAGMYNYSFNLEQDLLASQLLFSSGVPLVYLPGYYLGSQLTISLPEMQAYVRGRGAIGDYLHHLYTHNPLYAQRGIVGNEMRTWVIWDLINFAWLIDPAWVPTRFVPTPRLGDDQRWHTDGAPPHEMLEAYEIRRDSIFRDLFVRLDAFARTSV
ncbi:MAG: nucleoside hydrolase [Trueperaceae bacterium]|nr:nucleoside hydrolase [Trueperaceae bacterium]